ncbi:Zn(II)2Cys6 transcription factor (Eurofung) protein [Rutstroemia sp. NJR-2017a BVV2]|nr:Zn(II)2Cys6 transcription factor (Eurofung) protein [Rutstroemia sp. NJR-2017a BVV2]
MLTRHVKCDEGRPACNRCIKAKRTCEGYTSSPQPGKELLKFIIYSATAPSSGLSILPGITPRQQRSFDFFRLRTAIELAGPFEADLWSTVLLQTAHAEPAIINAVIALGALHESFGYAHDAHAATSEYALLHYGKAIQRILTLHDSNLTLHMDIVLMASIIFSAFESLRGHYKSALTHISSGINILIETDKRSGGLRTGSIDKDVVVPMFVRLENQVIEVGQTASMKSSISLLKRTPPSMPHAFKSVKEAHDAFDDFLSSLWHMLEHIEQESTSSSEPPGQQQRPSPAPPNLTMNPIEHFNSWCAAFDASNFPPMHPAVLILQVHRTMLSMLLSVNVALGETIWDPYLPQFRKLLDYADKIPAPKSPGARKLPHPVVTAPCFSYHLGLLTPLYFTCTRCRDPNTRRQALRMLENCYRKEGVWDSQLGAMAAKRIIQIEEMGAIETMRASGIQPNGEGGWIVQTAEQVPENARIRESDITLGTGREGTIRYIRSGSGPSWKAEGETERLVW